MNVFDRNINFDALFKFSQISRSTQQHLKSVYASLAVCMLLASAGSYLYCVTRIFQVWDSGHCWTTWSAWIPGNGRSRRSELGMVCGAHRCLFVSSIIMTAFLGTAVIFGCFTLSALYAQRRSYLFLGGALMSGLTMLLLLSFLNAHVYLGLLVMCGFVLFDTQLIIEKAEMGDKDYIWHCVDLFLDFVSIFRKLLIILSMNEKELLPLELKRSIRVPLLISGPSEERSRGSSGFLRSSRNNNNDDDDEEEEDGLYLFCCVGALKETALGSSALLFPPLKLQGGGSCLGFLLKFQQRGGGVLYSQRTAPPAANEKRTPPGAWRSSSGHEEGNQDQRIPHDPEDVSNWIFTRERFYRVSSQSNGEAVEEQETGALRSGSVEAPPRGSAFTSAGALRTAALTQSELLNASSGSPTLNGDLLLSAVLLGGWFIMTSSLKLAEKLLILNERGQGVLIRVYHIKKVFSEQKRRPWFFSDKGFESVDHVYELLNSIDASQCFFDITLNFDLTRNFLDLIICYASVIYLMSRVDDRKLILGFYNAAYEFTHGNSDPWYPRLGQMLLEYEQPWRKLSEEFGPHTRCVTEALLSLQAVYLRRNPSADQWRGAQLLSLLASPSAMLSPACCETMGCEYLPLDVMERWILLGFLLCPSSLNSNCSSQGLWKVALRSGACVSIVRDELLNMHKLSEELLDSLKGYGKRVADVRECKEHVLLNCGSFHREKRTFLRNALKELTAVLEDEPGLLGPKALYVFMALSFSRDEILWLVRHMENIPKTKTPEDYSDSRMAELLFYMEKLRRMLSAHRYVLQRYHLQYLSQYDAVVLSDMIQGMYVCPEEESAYSSVNKAALVLKDYPDLARVMNLCVFHTLMLDGVEELLLQTADLSALCFHVRVFEKLFSQNVEDTGVQRYLLSFPLLCSHFHQSLHPLCPEETEEVEKQSLKVCVSFLEEISRQTCSVILEICSEQRNLHQKLLPVHSAETISAVRNKRMKKPPLKKTDQPREKAGAESLRKDRVLATTLDKLHLSLSELCSSFSFSSEFSVFDHIVAPAEFLLSQLEMRLNKLFVQMAGYNVSSGEICRPSDLRAGIEATVSTLHSLSRSIRMDLSRLVKSVLLQQTQPLDSHGAQTITTLYTNWCVWVTVLPPLMWFSYELDLSGSGLCRFLEVLLRQASSALILHSPLTQSFVNQITENQQSFQAEEFSDISGLRALAELIGPYGMKFLNENLMWHVVSQVGELKKLVMENMDVLVQMRGNHHLPEVMSALQKKLSGSENVLKRLTIIGVILSFRSMIQEALEEVMDRHCSFLMKPIRNLKDSISPELDIKVTLGVYELASAAGFSCEIDPALVSAISNMQSESQSSEEEFKISSLLLVFVAVSLPSLCADLNSSYNQHGGHQNNIHCLARAVNHLAAAMFTVQRKNIQTQLQDFLQVASSVLLLLDRGEIKNRASIYLLLLMIVDESPFLSQEMLEKSFPYVLLRNAYTEMKRASHLMQL
ncbi:hypothetical protein DNTS_018583 [Danionella cerebrum]|uniref:Uncharacterized protein n=1 Tax=Danionella cerebrum TaxID=2873325 RepID=A0A553Q9M4_9TELE|nr:hypothetical protein DNTS_018583 [Danionella translucida]